MTLKWILVWVVMYVDVFQIFYLSCEFYLTELQRIGPVIHLFHSPHAIVIALVQCWFLLDTFSQSPQAHFPLLDQVWKDNTEPHVAAVHGVPPGETSFQSERVISGQNWDYWGDLPMNGAVCLCGTFLLTQVCFLPAVEEKCLPNFEMSLKKQQWNA